MGEKVKLASWKSKTHFDPSVGSFSLCVEKLAYLKCSFGMKRVHIGAALSGMVRFLKGFHI